MATQGVVNLFLAARMFVGGASDKAISQNNQVKFLDALKGKPPVVSTTNLQNTSHSTKQVLLDSIYLPQKVAKVELKTASPTDNNTILPRFSEVIITTADGSYSFKLDTIRVFEFANLEYVLDMPADIASKYGSISSYYFADSKQLSYDIVVPSKNTKYSVTVDFVSGSISVSTNQQEQSSGEWKNLARDSYPFNYNHFDNARFGDTTQAWFPVNNDLKNILNLPVVDFKADTLAQTIEISYKEEGKMPHKVVFEQQGNLPKILHALGLAYETSGLTYDVPSKTISYRLHDEKNEYHVLIIPVVPEDYNRGRYVLVFTNGGWSSARINYNPSLSGPDPNYLPWEIRDNYYKPLFDALRNAEKQLRNDSK